MKYARTHVNRNRRNASGVAPLSASCRRCVRFEEVDALRYMWHGRYASWLEDGRECLGQRYGISYLDFLNHGIIVPIKLLQIDYIRPLRYAQTYTINVILYWTEAAVLDFTYSIMDSTGTITTRASTTQLMVDLEDRLCIEQPSFYKDFARRWQEGLLE